MNVYIIKDFREEVFLCSVDEHKFNHFKELSKLAEEENESYEKNLKEHLEIYINNREDNNEFYSCDLNMQLDLDKVKNKFYKDYKFYFQNYLKLTSFEQYKITDL